MIENQLKATMVTWARMDIDSGQPRRTGAESGRAQPMVIQDSLIITMYWEILLRRSWKSTILLVSERFKFVPRGG